jgi:hypothetical protein
LVRAARTLGAELGVGTATYCFGGRLALRLADGWALLISPDDAGRFRLEVARSDRVVATMWCMEGDRRRLAELARSAQTEAAALAV